MESTNGAPGDLYMYDLIMIPVDEWAVEYRWAFELNWNEYLDAGITYPKIPSRCTTRESDDAIEDFAQVISNGAPILQANARQRYWFFPFYATYGDAFFGGTVRLQRQQRYLSLRGDR